MLQGRAKWWRWCTPVGSMENSGSEKVWSHFKRKETCCVVQGAQLAACDDLGGWDEEWGGRGGRSM